MASDAAKNHVRSIIEREQRAMARTPSDEQLLFLKAETIAKEVVATGKQVFYADKNRYDRNAMLGLMKKLYQQKFLAIMTKEEMAYLLAEMHAQETVHAVET